MDSHSPEHAQRMEGNAMRQGGAPKLVWGVAAAVGVECCSEGRKPFPVCAGSDSDLMAGRKPCLSAGSAEGTQVIKQSHRAEMDLLDKCKGNGRK